MKEKIFNEKKTNNKENTKGITLVSLVVTVVLLLILAGISIIALSGDNNVIDLSGQIANEANSEIDKSLSEIEELRNKLGESMGNINNGGTEKPVVPDETKGPNGNTLVGKIELDDTQNQLAEDKNGNLITIPAGFTVVPNSPEGTSDAEKVTYSYNGDGTPAVQDGIVIQDSEGNQFVWVPVGTIYNKEKDASGNRTTTEIILGRYSFEFEFDAETKKITGGTGNPILKQAAYTDEKPENFREIVSIHEANKLENESYQELLNSSGNTAAADLAEFITKTKEKGGYYIARYEASKGSDTKVKVKANQTPWGSAKETEVSLECRKMYNEENNYSTDLINSYSWDTAIVFIQNYSEGDSDYSIQTPVKSTLSQTGNAGDVACNIHDMSSNCYEVSTEHCTYVDTEGTTSPVTVVGGDYQANCVTSNRTYCSTNWANSRMCFRPILYVK